MTINALQAADAVRIVRENEEKAAEIFLAGAMDYIRKAAETAVQSITADIHPNPNVQHLIEKGLEDLGYKVSREGEPERLTISWRK